MSANKILLMPLAVHFAGLTAIAGTILKGEERDEMVRRLVAIREQLVRAMDPNFAANDFEVAVAKAQKIAAA